MVGRRHLRDQLPATAAKLEAELWTLEADLRAALVNATRALLRAANPPEGGMDPIRGCNPTAHNTGRGLLLRHSGLKPSSSISFIVLTLLFFLFFLSPYNALTQPLSSPGCWLSTWLVSPPGWTGPHPAPAVQPWDARRRPGFASSKDRGEGPADIQSRLLSLYDWKL